MSLKDQENKLLKEIDDLGLERRVRHIRILENYGDTLQVKIEGETYKNTRALTLVMLIDKDTEEDIFYFYDIAGDDDLNLLIRNEYDYKYKALGYAVCSGEDNFNKTKGRLIATGRALKNYRR